VLGSGGMGSVYAAERADATFERTVAVKILRTSMNRPEVASRFEQERQILASLNHPSIAGLIDGGVTDDGRPYLVMELVDGVAIDEWADRARLGVEDRIRVVVSVAEAVEYAHRHMVVHRDLKPSNILVCEDGSVKLLDFGVAKLLDEAGDAAAVTATRSRFLTPEYAAPEQLLGEAASAQTDVYSLAALLYELLTGVRPYARDSGGTMLEQVVVGGEPTAPLAVRPPPTLEHTGPSTKALQRRLAGDLDAILLRALRARPSERYASVAAFADDLTRHLDGRAVAARGDARAYRLRKFLWLHRGAAAALAGTLLLATGSAVGLAFQRGNLIEQRHRADLASIRAGEEAEAARQTTAFLVDLFEANDPNERLGDTLTARALLHKGVAQLDTDLATQPVVRAELLEALGRIHVNLGLQDDGVQLLERAVQLVQDSIPGEPGLAGKLGTLGGALQQRNDYELAREAFREAADVARSTGDSTALGHAKVDLGSALRSLNQPEEAEVELRAGLALLPDSAAERWVPQQILAGIIRQKGDLNEADRLYSEVVDARRRTAGTEPLSYARALNDLAVNRRHRERYDEAVVLYREAIDTARAVLGAGHPEVVILNGNLAHSLTSLARFDEAVQVYEESVRALREQWPQGHWSTARALMRLGAARIVADQPEQAIPPLSEAVDMAIEEIGRFHSWTNVYRCWMGVAATLSGRKDAATRFMGWCLEGLSSYEGLKDDRMTVSMVQSLVDTMRDKGLDEEARPVAALLEPEPGR
ncbi:MAG: protein kinase domain-containing protein, partial [Longimicrobiales bacterium]